MQERNYQVALNNDVATQLPQKRKVLMYLPTGGGKTVCFAKLAQRYILNSGKSVLILVHREELMYQAAKTIEEMLNIKPYLITSKTNKYYVSRVYIGMVESTISRLNMFDNVGMVIIDECHIANFNKIHSIFLEEYIVGVTATPISSSKKQPLNKYYNAICLGPQIPELIEMGFLAQNVTRCPKNVVDATQFSIDAMSGDYNERQMYNEYKLPKHVLNTVNRYFQFCFGKKTLVFNVNIAHSKEVAEAFVFCGHNARHLASDNIEERAETLKWFRETENAILCNVMLFTFGFDEPTVQNIILNYSTLSMPKFLQSCGRGSRPIDEEWIEKHQHRYPYPLSTKTHFNIIDMGGNCIRFGDWNDVRDWEYIFNHPQLPGEGIAPVKTCPDCEGLLHAAKMVCDLQNEDGEMCLHEFQRRKTAEEQDLEEMILITKGIDVDQLIGQHKKKHMYFTFLEMADPVVAEMFKKHGKDQSPKTQRKFFQAYYELCKDWYNKTLAGVDGNMDDISNSAWHIKRALDNFNRIVSVYSAKYQMEVPKLEGLKEVTHDYISFEENLELHPGLINPPTEYEYNLKVEPEQIVEHKNLGRGKVIRIQDNFDNDIAVVKFDNYEEEKKIIVRYAKLRLLA